MKSLRDEELIFGFLSLRVLLHLPSEGVNWGGELGGGFGPLLRRYVLDP